MEHHALNDHMRNEIRKVVQSTLQETDTMSRSDVKSVVREAVHETLLTLGVDAGEPLTVQQDMHFIRELRGASETIRSRGLFVLVGILVTALVGAAWLGVRNALGAP
jgi:hypothetical protein